MAPGTPTVLLVDDDQGLRLLLQMELEAAGFRVIEYGSAEEALAAYSPAVPTAGPATGLAAYPESIDLAVLDYNLPGASGLMLLRQLRVRRGDLPALMISSEQQLTRRPDWPGKHTRLLAKPFCRSHFLSSIHQLAARDPGSA